MTRGLAFCLSLLVSLRMATAEDAFAFKGLTVTDQPEASTYEVISGPTAKLPGVLVRRAPQVLKAKLDAPSLGRGSLSFWFRTDQAYRSGKGIKPVNVPFIELPGALTVSFQGTANMVTVFVEWFDPAKKLGAQHIRIQMPELPGPAWHHFALRWEGAAGDVNAWIDGTPFYVPGEKVAPFPIGEAREAVVHLDRFALADVRIAPDSTASDFSTIEESVLRKKELAYLLGAGKMAQLTLFPLPEPIYTNALDSAKSVADWKLEGPGILTVADGWLEMRSERPDGPEGNVVLWCPQEFPANFQAEWDFQVSEPKGLAIVFFAARGQEGRDIFDPSLTPRTGIFGQYINGDISCYHISYFSNAPDVPRATSNLRKNPGFYLIGNGPAGVPSGLPADTIHRAVLRKTNDHLQMSVDGKTIIDQRDDGLRAGEILGRGKIGLRQMQWSALRYRNFRVYALPDKK